ncbi:UNVERIFIED_CONTAM: hypothetical protein PYX00_005748 [Menopon gallinae]|uniref:Uncharacterized protein n=1 Tax=Menopon gallinae TaxID=328185 RepID=A0AAW2HT66_9NEOP
MPMIISRFTTGMSAKEYIHLLQFRESDKFRQFDYGKKGNLKVYRQSEPPSFNISQVQVPTYLYYGPNDLFVSERDLFKFALQLPNLKGLYRIPFAKFNHIDYMWAKVANTLLYPNLMNVIDQYNK